MRIALILACVAGVAPAQTPVVVSFADGPPTAFAKSSGRGFDFGILPDRTDGGVAADKPFFYSVALPEGNYVVTVTLGSGDTTIKAESRRLMLEGVRTAKGETATHAFAVNVRTPAFGAERVRLKDREKDVLHWDDKLTLEFNGPRPAVRTLTIRPAPEIPTLFILGDSTVTDQPREPWAGWGMMLPRFFGPGVAVANHAESGESLKSTRSAKRLDKVLAAMKPGDYLFLQFGHNDMKDKSAGAGAFTSYAADLTAFVTAARERGGKPVLVTSMHRKNFDAAGKVVETLGDYPEAVRRVAKTLDVPLIDLHAMSRTLYEAWGPGVAAKAFVNGSHHTNYGAYELAKCVVNGIRANVPDLAKQLADAPAFDPAKPDAVDAVRIPVSPQQSAVKPDGSE